MFKEKKEKFGSRIRSFHQARELGEDQPLKKKANLLVQALINPASISAAYQEDFNARISRREQNLRQEREMLAQQYFCYKGVYYKRLHQFHDDYLSSSQINSALKKFSEKYH